MDEWFDNKRNLHSGYDFRRKKTNKKLFIILLIVVAISLIFAYDIGNIKTSIKQGIDNLTVSTKRNYTAIKDIAQNKDDYVDKDVKIKGKLTYRMGGDTLDDKDGYFIFLDEISCEERNRDYDYGSRYTAEGKLTKSGNIYLTEYWFICDKYLY